MNRRDTWNVKGINGNAKREEMVDVFKKGEMELPALNDVWYSEVIDNWMWPLRSL